MRSQKYELNGALGNGEVSTKDPDSAGSTSISCSLFKIILLVLLILCLVAAVITMAVILSNGDQVNPAWSPAWSPVWLLSGEWWLAGIAAAIWQPFHCR